MKLQTTFILVLLSLVFVLFICLFTVVDDCNEYQKKCEVRLKQNELYVKELQTNFQKLYNCYKTDERIEELGWEEINKLETSN